MGHVDEYPTMHYFRIPGHIQSMIAYKILTEYFWKCQRKIALWDVVNLPYLNNLAAWLVEEYPMMQYCPLVCNLSMIAYKTFAVYFWEYLS